MIPLAFIAKGPLRHFDATNGDGDPMPILGMSESSELAFHALLEVLKRNNIQPTEHVKTVVKEVIGPQTPGHETDVNILLRSGHWKGQRVWSHSVTLKPEASSLLAYLGKNFLLVGLIPTESLGRRQIIKFSFHWQQSTGAQLAARQFMKTLLGVPLRLEIEMIMPDAAKSYHLEFQTPGNLISERLSLPEAGNAPERRDEYGEPVAHVYGSYTNTPTSPATLLLSAPRLKGTSAVAAGASAVMACIFALLIYIPEIACSALSAPEGTVTILIAIPGALAGYVAITSKSRLASTFQSPYRFMLFLIAATLLLTAAGFTLTDLNAIQYPLWKFGLTIGAIFTGIILIPIGRIFRFRR